MVLCITLWYIAVICCLLPTSFEKAPLQYWGMILLLPAPIFCAWHEMPFSGSSPSFLLEEGSWIIWLCMPRALLCSASFSSRQPSAEQPQATPSTKSTALCFCDSPAPLLTQHLWGFSYFCTLAWHLLILFILEPLPELVGDFLAFFPPPVSLPCPHGYPYETPPFLPAEQALFQARQKLSITVLVIWEPTQ